MEPADVFAIIGIVIVIGFFAEWVFRRTNIPDVLALIMLGLVIGQLAGPTSPADMATFAPIIAPIALMVLLFDGGLHMNIYKVLYGTPRAGLFGIMNVLISILLGAIVFKLALGWDFYLGAILGAIVGGTSSAIVLPIVRKLDIGEEAKDMLGLESAVTDVLCIVATITVINIAVQTQFSNPANFVMGTFSIGIMLGSLGGLLWLSVLHRFKGLSYMLTLAVIFLIYAFSEWSGGSGAIAALLFGLVLGNREDFSKLFRIGDTAQGDRKNLQLMQTEISFFVKTFFFVYLGMIVSVSNINVILWGVVFSLILITARYFSTWLITRKSELEKHVNLIATMGPRGLAAAVLAQVPFAKGINQEQTVLMGDFAFVVIVTTVVVSSLGVAYLSKKDSNCRDDSDNPICRIRNMLKEEQESPQKGKTSPPQKGTSST